MVDTALKIKKQNGISIDFHEIFHSTKALINQMLQYNSGIVFYE